MAAVGQSKEKGMLDAYNGTLPGTSRSKYSTQNGNQTLAGQTVTGGFTATGEYVEKYAGGNGNLGAGTPIAHSNYEVFTRTTEQSNGTQAVNNATFYD